MAMQGSKQYKTNMEQNQDFCMEITTNYIFISCGNFGRSNKNFLMKFIKPKYYSSYFAGDLI